MSSIDLELQVLPVFPADVVASTGMRVDNEAGIYTFGLDYSQLSEIVLSAVDPSNLMVVVWDRIANQYAVTTLTELGVAATGTQRLITAAGNVGVGASDGLIQIKKTVPQLTTLFLPSASSRNGLPLAIEHIGATQLTSTIVPIGGETIDSLSSITIDNPFGFFWLRPYLDGTGYKIINAA
jgi:hypothetical protein